MAATKDYDTHGYKVITVCDDNNKVQLPPPPAKADTTANKEECDNKVQLPPPPAKAETTANKEECGICATIVWSIVGLFLLISFFYLIIVDLYRDPTGLPKFQIQSVVATPILINTSSSSSSSHCKIDFNFTFSITKGLDDTTILYNFDSVSLFYHHKFLFGTTLVPLFQGPEEQSTVVARFSVEPSSADEWVAVNEIVADRWWRGVVQVGLEVGATVKNGPHWMRDSDWQMMNRYARVTCDKVKVVFWSNSSSFGTLDKGPKDCYFEYLN